MTDPKPVSQGGVREDYSAEEAEWLRFLTDWKKRRRRPYPTNVDLFRLAKAFLAGRGDPAPAPLEPPADAQACSLRPFRGPQRRLSHLHGPDAA